jgi:hypothetical protein
LNLCAHILKAKARAVITFTSSVAFDTEKYLEMFEGGWKKTREELRPFTPLRKLL